MDVNRHFLNVGGIYVYVDVSVFFGVVDQISRTHVIIREKLDRVDSFTTIYYASLEDVPFPENKEIGFISTDK